MQRTVAHITFTEGPYHNRTYILLNPTEQPPEYVNVTDGGNTIEDDKGRIIGHYVHMHNPETDGVLPDPETLPPC